MASKIKQRIMMVSEGPVETPTQPINLKSPLQGSKGTRQTYNRTHFRMSRGRPPKESLFGRRLRLQRRITRSKPNTPIQARLQRLQNQLRSDLVPSYDFEEAKKRCREEADEATKKLMEMEVNGELPKLPSRFTYSRPDRHTAEGRSREDVRVGYDRVFWKQAITLSSGRMVWLGEHCRCRSQRLEGEEKEEALDLEDSRSVGPNEF